MKKTLKLLGLAALAAVIIFSMAGCSDGSDNDNKGGTPTFTVTFNADGGSPAPQKQRVAKGGKVAEPPAMTKADHVFDGWFKEAAFTNLWNFAADTVTGNITLYAKWHPGHTVTFNADNGTANTTQAVAKGGKATEPADPTKANDVAGLFEGTPAYTFDGWQKDGTAYDFDAIVTADITLTAAWTDPSPIDLSSTSGANIIAKSVAYINTDTGGTTEYTLVLDDDVANVAAITHYKNGTTLTITSVDTTERIISKGTAANGTVFTVGGTSTTASSAKLVIDGTVTLQGKSGNDAAVVNVSYGGSLELKGNAKITGNASTNTSSSGGVYAQGNADNRVTITMSGNAEISNNNLSENSFALYGGGVYLAVFANLTMSGSAAIKNNSVSCPGTAYALGGGVYIGNNSTFTMNGGEISGNTATGSDTGLTVQGGGVYIANANTVQFIVASEAVKANIKNNTVTHTGSGTAEGPQVFKAQQGVFTVGGVAATTY